MTFRDAVNATMNSAGDARVRRKAWRTDGWRLTVCATNGGIWWSHRTPLTTWMPTWDDLDATDWEVA